MHHYASTQIVRRYAARRILSIRISHTVNWFQLARVWPTDSSLIYARVAGPIRRLAIERDYRLKERLCEALGRALRCAGRAVGACVGGDVGSPRRLAY
jgi:hypothetical protein